MAKSRKVGIGTRSRMALVIAAVAGLCLEESAAMAGNKDYFSSGISLATPGNYTSNSLPSNTTDISVTDTTSNVNTGASSITLDSGSAVTMESLNVINGGTYKFSNVTGSGSSTLTLGNSSGFTDSFDPGAGSDLIYVDNNSSLSISNTSGGTFNVALASNGNFNVGSGSSLTINTPITGGFIFTKTGLGTLYLTNSAATDGNTSGGTTVSANVSSGFISLASQGDLGINPASLAAGASDIILNGGGLQAAGNLTFQGSFRGITLGVNGGTLDANGYTINVNPIAGGAGTGGLTITSSAAGGSVVFNQSGSSYTGGTTIAGGATVKANGSSGSLGTGLTNVSNGTLAGIGSTGGAVLIGSSGIIGSGSGTAATNKVGTLTTGTETWNSGGTLVSKFNSTTGTTVAASDKLIISGLSVLPSGGTFNVSVLEISGTGITALTLPSNGVIVLADDTNSPTTNNPTNPFTSTVLSELNLTTSGITAAPGYQLALGTQSDGTGYDLILDETTAPEPTSAILLGAVVAPLLLGRRRQMKL